MRNHVKPGTFVGFALIVLSCSLMVSCEQVMDLFGLSTVSVSGQVAVPASSNPAASAKVHVQLLIDSSHPATFAGNEQLLAYDGSGLPLAFSFPKVPKGYYFLRVFLDLDGNGVQDASEILAIFPESGQPYDFRKSVADIEVAIAATDAQAVTADAEALQIGFANGNSALAVTADLSLPISGANGTTISWASGDLSLVSDSGVVTLPLPSTTIEVTLTATISRGYESSTRDFTINVLPAPGAKQTYTAEGVSFDLVCVHGKSFPIDIDDSGTATVAYPYWIAETELTYQLWQSVYVWATDSARGAYQYVFANPGAKGSGPSGETDQDPAVSMSWRDAIVWCNAATEWYNAANSTGYGCVYASNGTPLRDATDSSLCDAVIPDGTATGFRLCTTDEWELAARYINDADNDGDILDSGEYYPGNYPSGGTAAYTDSTALGLYARYSMNYLDFYTVKGKLPNALGLYDMSGNEWEWCFDASGPANRVVRGGSWRSAAYKMQVGDFFRENAPGGVDVARGFRLASGRGGGSGRVVRLPDAPSGLAANPISGGIIRLTWTDTTWYESGFKIERSPSGGSNFAEIASVPTDTVSYDDSSFTAGSSYDYRVCAWNYTGRSAWSDVATSSAAYYLTYDGNGNSGGTAPTDGAGYSPGATVTAAGNSGYLVKINVTGASYRFAGWNTQADGNGTTYAAGTGTFSMGASDATLYAKWVEYALRDTGPAGGLIFCIQSDYSDGWRYMEAAPADQGTGAWGTSGNNITGAIGTAVGTGSQNTIAIVNDDPLSDTAADICANYSLTNNGVAYDDWFLPSLYELNKMYVNLKSGTDENSVTYTPVTGFASFYWSSSQFNSLNGYDMIFGISNPGYQGPSSKDITSYSIRAVREF